MTASSSSTDGAELISAARGALGKAYAPYSSYKVACALLTEDGSVITGVNVENASYGLTICAERCAICSAVAAGHRRIKAAAVIAGSGGGTPCGACRQVLAEFMHADAPVFVLEQDGTISRYTVGGLLPAAFSGPGT